MNDRFQSGYPIFLKYGIQGDKFWLLKKAIIRKTLMSPKVHGQKECNQ